MTTLLVAATGGHLKQLHVLHRSLADAPPPYRWVTFDSPQSRSLLAGEAVSYIDVIGTRDPVNALRAIPTAHRLIAATEATSVISTGSAVALPFMLAGRARGCRCMYIESAARADGPSVTGRMVSAIPGMELYTQYPSWGSNRWRYRTAVYDAFQVEAGNNAKVRLTSVVVSLGTMSYPFEQLVRRLLEILPSDAEVLWQVGSTDARSFGIHGVAALPEHELSAAMRQADVVIAHAGVGSALAALEVGKVPVLVPRRASRGEHVDDHQQMIAGELQRRGLAVKVEVEELELEHLQRAAGAVVSRSGEPPSSPDPAFGP